MRPVVLLTCLVDTIACAFAVVERDEVLSLCLFQRMEVFLNVQIDRQGDHGIIFNNLPFDGQDEFGDNQVT